MEKEFKKLIKRNRYQVFLFSSPASFPFNLFLHYWFILAEKGKISRWELLHREVKHKKKFGHLYINFLPPTKGIEILPFSSKYSWNGRIEGYIEGNKNSVSKKMINFIKKSEKNYPFCYKYNLMLGPNSNTFVQWVINKFPEAKFKLSWRAIGKNYNFS